MKIKIDSAQTLGQVVRAVRKDQQLRQDDAAGSVGVSENFLGKLERGAEGVQLGKVLLVLAELGIEMYADVTESSAQRIMSSLQAAKRDKVKKA
jgi:transcriptional regulator with XRE-family HTH domain